MQIVGHSNNQIHIQYVVDIEFIYQISIVPVNDRYYFIVDSFIPEYAKVVKTANGWMMTHFAESLADVINETVEHELSYPYTLTEIGSFYEDNYELMLEMLKSA